MKSAGKARNNGLYRHIRTSKEIIRNLLNDFIKQLDWQRGPLLSPRSALQQIFSRPEDVLKILALSLLRVFYLNATLNRANHSASGCRGNTYPSKQRFSSLADG